MVQDLFDLTGKTALVTGASSGLGKHFAETLAKAGARLAIAARRSGPLEELAGAIEGQGGRALPVTIDVKDPASVRKAVSIAETELGPLDILVNNAGVAATTPALKIEEEEWLHVMETNLSGVFRVAQAVAERMAVAKRPGVIVNIASILSLGGAAQLASYAATKHGVHGMTKSMAVEWARMGIRVNALAPGYFETDMNRDTLNSDVGEVLRKKIPQRRFGQLPELDGPLLLLCSDASSHMTGTILVVDGGQTASI